MADEAKPPSPPITARKPVRTKARAHKKSATRHYGLAPSARHSLEATPPKKP